MFTPSNYFNLNSRKIGSTEFFEKERKAFEDEYNDFLSFSTSEEFLRLQYLNSWFNSNEHKRIKKELEALTYKRSDEYKVEAEMNQISKKSAFRNYLKLSKTNIPDFFNSVKNSGQIEELDQLESFVKSADYRKNRSNYKKENTDEYKKEIQYNVLKSNADIRRYKKLQKDTALQNYFQILNSDILSRYNQLKETTETPEFIERKKYLLSNDKFKKSEAFAMLEERKQLLVSPRIKWYEKTLKTKKFKGIGDWQVKFEDTFDTPTLDSTKWLNKFYWGEKLVNQSYSFTNTKQGYTDNNIELTGKSLKIITRNEKNKGLAWDAKYGFMPKEFEYSSGTINTGQSYRQTSGRIEAKVKLNCANGIYHAMYLVGDKKTPQLDVFHKFDSNPSTIEGGYIYQKGKKVVKRLKTAKGINLNGSANIFTIEWDSRKIYWAINGSVYKTDKNISPDLPLYIVFASGVNGQPDSSSLPATMEIEWVKCWTKTS